MRLKDFIDDIPYLTSGTVDENLYSDLQRASKWLKDHYRGKVTGLWWITKPAQDDGGRQVIIRYAHELPIEKFDIHDGVFDKLHHESLWVIMGDEAEGIDEMLGEFFFPENIYCVFDDNREKSDEH